MTGHARKGFTCGTHRLVPPAETLARLGPLLPRMGITRLANVTGLDTIGIPVVMACRPNSRSISVAQGKGLDLDAAKASAAMESVEGYHAERISLPLKLASYEELRAGHRVVDVERLPRAEHGWFHPHRPLLWIEGEDWLNGETAWAPYHMVHTAYTVAMAFDLSCFYPSSTGLASGNHPLEAASHGICEVVERDASLHSSLMTEEEQDARRIDLDSVDDPGCRSVLERYQRAGVAVSVWDTTSAVGIAAFDCKIVDRREDPLRPMCAAGGAGCHPVRHIALLRALTEAAQSRLTAISGARDDMMRPDYRAWVESENLAMQRRRLDQRGSRLFQEVPTFESGSFEEDVAWELDRVRRAGYEHVVVVDLTHPEIGLPVVRVVIPGMERAPDWRVPEAIR